MIFNVLGANNDDHPKSFSFLWREGGSGWELSPAYDETHAYDPNSKWVAKDLTSVNGKFDAITKAELRAVAERFDVLAEFNAVVERVEAALHRWGREPLTKISATARPSDAPRPVLTKQLRVGQQAHRIPGRSKQTGSSKATAPAIPEATRSASHSQR